MERERGTKNESSGQAWRLSKEEKNAVQFNKKGAVHWSPQSHYDIAFQL